MPSNRRVQPEAERRGPIVAAARQLFTQNGYEATSMASIAATAGVTPNTIYWYFKDKDELLVGVLDVLLQEDIQAYASEAATKPAVEKLWWAVERLRAFKGLVTTVHNRVNLSPRLNEWHEAFHTIFEGFLSPEMPSAWSEAQRKAEARVVSFTIEGLLSHGVDREDTLATCRALADRWAL
ncbi:TetR/AcrR family transcriptional regulator [Aquabacterium sp.]|uniref:TetR/AcrR family transcriptional regulator n=1 Tax=Aquabacterium sp. TaxID=1872578 RepID=UPI003D6CEE69